MKKRLFCLVALIALVVLPLTACRGGEADINTAEGDISFGQFSAVDMNGNPINESVFSDKKLTMINVWATFCSPCIDEMPALARLNSAYGEDFRIIGIPLDVVDGKYIPVEKNISEAKRIISETGANYMHIVPSGSLFYLHLSEVQVVPETIFVDRNGKQIGDVYLGARSEKEWASIIEQLLGSVE